MAVPEDRTYPTRPYVGVGVVVFRRDEVLLCKRGKEPRRDGWSIPGGAQETGETVFEAGRRELAEETGVDAEIFALIDVIDAISRDGDGRVRMHYTLVDVVGEWRAGEAAAADDVAEVMWCKIDEVERFVTWSETLRVIREAAGMRQAR